MEPEDVTALIEDELSGATAEVQRARGEDDDDHLAATVVSPVFEDVPLVDRHEMVYDALGEHMTEDIHAIELRTDTPAEHDG